MLKEQFEKIKNGDLEQLDKIYMEVKPLFMSYAQRNFRAIPISDMEDIYQDAIIVFYQNIQKGLLLEINSSLSAYIIQIGKMRLIKWADKKGQHTDLGEFYAENALSEDLYDPKIDEAVKFVFSKMSDACKQILNLFYFHKKSMEEIAEILQYKNANTVKSQKSRCIAAFSQNVIKLNSHE